MRNLSDSTPRGKATDSANQNANAILTTQCDENIPGSEYEAMGHDQRLQEFYAGIGQMTRVLHSATRSLDEIHQQDSDDIVIDLSRQADTNFLKYVKDLTADSTSKVLDKLEATAPLLERSQLESRKLAEEIATYRKQGSSAKSNKLSDSLLNQFENYLTMNSATMEGISTSQSEILSLQSYQDLTSQAINKAENLLNNLEAKLTELLSDFSRIKDMEVTTLQSPPTQAEAEADTESDEPDSEYLAQDGVDALLSKLGF